MLSKSIYPFTISFGKKYLRPNKIPIDSFRTIFIGTAKACANNNESNDKFRLP